MKKNEFKNRTAPELQQELTELLKEQFKLRMQRGSKQSVRTHLIREVRRNIARVKTFLSKKENMRKEEHE
ncbi:MAG: 50S ribosomal protein L29 [Pseudomonadota bacterium]|nr:50S ribosomal protein L29 [Gammaproteobacteria bacterium]MBU1559166.1 50S ribosomal protein L29 [Gammaproteobacteria bacterium]MBU1628805.1 50S ribosomal protein L29 [Gammaproteobacteria bacterium]MBU1926704.1 50S ribosomal protein L29 [Gammaproteobacteria bacterium]MBU2545978.1 50S ribosomal protein L29 [Gammaproteobacteria bacterium]